MTVQSSSTDSLAESTMSEKVKYITRQIRKCSTNGHRQYQISELRCASSCNGTLGFCFRDRQTESPIDSNDWDSYSLSINSNDWGFRLMVVACVRVVAGCCLEMRGYRRLWLRLVGFCCERTGTDTCLVRSNRFVVGYR
jgi:hypothetical protein